MISLTPTQSKLLVYIEKTLTTTGVAPSYDEMREHMGLASKSNIHRIIGELVQRGRLRVMRKHRRAMEIVEQKCRHCGKEL